MLLRQVDGNRTPQKNLCLFGFNLVAVSSGQREREAQQPGIDPGLKRTREAGPQPEGTKP